MLDQAIKELTRLSVEANLPRVLPIEDEASNIRHVWTPDGLKKIELTPEPRSHALFSLEAFADFMKDVDTTADVFYSFGEINVFPDQDNRWDGLQFKLTPSRQLTTLTQLDVRPIVYKSQRELIKLLRIELYCCLATAGNFLQNLRSLKFSSSIEGDANLQHGKESLGKKISSQIAGADVIPEEVELIVPMFDNLESPGRKVRCAVDLDHQNETIAFLPLPGQLSRAKTATEEWLGSRLVALLPNHRILHGNP